MAIAGIESYTSISPYNRVSGTVSGKSATGKSVKDMELAEYKKYIDNKINQIPFHTSHRKITETLVISEEGYQAMKDDPEYEKWVLEHIRENRSVNMSLMTGRNDYLSGTDYEYIGATKDQCYGYGSNCWKDKTRTTGTAAKKKDNMEQQVKKQMEKKRLQKAYYEKLALKKSIENSNIGSRTTASTVNFSYQASFVYQGKADTGSVSLVEAIDARK